jgi:MFS family permease
VGDEFRRHPFIFISASLIGSSLEWYDFLLSSTAASLIWPKVFFPTQTPIIGLLLSVTAFGVGIMSRPLGALLFGNIADTRGRANSLIYTLLTMGLGTLGIALTPSYQVIGIGGGILLFVFRFLQGIGLGGEYGSVNTWIAEHANKSKFRGLMTGFSQFGVPIGLIASSLSFTIIESSTSASYLLSIGWRIPFLIGFVAAIIGAIIRHRISESPVFREMERKREVVRYPFALVFKEQLKLILLITGSALGLFSTFYLELFSQSLIVSTGLSASFATLTVLLAGGLALILNAVLLTISDYKGRRKVILAGALWDIIWSIPFFYLVTSKNPFLVAIAMLLFLPITNSAIFAVGTVYYLELFPAKYRASGMSISYQLAGIFGGALAPIFASLIISSLGGALNSILYLGIMNLVYALISLICFILMRRETKGIDLNY